MPSSTPQPPANAGLCTACQHARLVESARGAVYVLCAAHKTHPQLPKYPRLPVRDCVAYAPASESPKKDQS